MIAQQLIDQIRELNKYLSRKELEEQYYVALYKLNEGDLARLRDSLLLESTIYARTPEIDL
jgi:hypothetical protein